MSPLSFTKMQGLANDFLVVASFTQPFIPDKKQIQTWADRRLGVGFDQLLWLSPATDANCTALYRIFNADGEEAWQCGNGARCVAQFLIDQGLHSGHGPIQLQMQNHTIIQVERTPEHQYQVSMGDPQFVPKLIPILPNTIKTTDTQQGLAPTYLFSYQNQSLKTTVLSMGNPHAVIWVEDCQQAPLQEWGPFLQHHSAFPEQVNVGVAERLSDHQIRLRVYERGAGETLACGTGACAAVVAGQSLGLINHTVAVEQGGGICEVHWDPTSTHGVMLTGPATTVFTGQLH